jgi:putative aldouronate transport system permease protein
VPVYPKRWAGMIFKGVAIMLKTLKKDLPLHIMLLPPVVILIIYSYIPMLGIIIAFEDYMPGTGFKSPFIGFDNFVNLFTTQGFFQALWNTVFIALMKIIAGLFVPVVIALLLNEVKKTYYKRTIQTIVYLPFFISWVLMAAIIINILSPTNGIVNQLLGQLGVKPVFFLGNNTSFPYLMVITDTWKNAGFGTIIYMAALAGIDPTIYEAAVIDGAGRWKQTLHITLPGISTTIVLLAALSLGQILNAGFDQIFNLISPITMQNGEIIDTLVYKLAFTNGQFSIATAAGLFKSVISCLFLVVSYKLADRLVGYKLF